ncbi:MAG: hypothetical protein WAV67_11680, partial [Dokdonella sp.]
MASALARTGTAAAPRAPMAQDENSGVVVSVRGSVVDICFKVTLPSIHSVLTAGAHGQIIIEVLAHRDARHVRG